TAAQSFDDPVDPGLSDQERHTRTGQPGDIATDVPLCRGRPPLLAQGFGRPGCRGRVGPGVRGSVPSGRLPPRRPKPRPVPRLRQAGPPEPDEGFPPAEPPRPLARFDSRGTSRPG